MDYRETKCIEGLYWWTIGRPSCHLTITLTYHPSYILLLTFSPLTPHTYPHTPLTPHITCSHYTCSPHTPSPSRAGENGSMVSAHLSRSGILTAFIRTPSELYYVEPSDNHISGPHPFQMIAYRGSDVRRHIDPKAMDYIVPPVENVTSNWGAPYFMV